MRFQPEWILRILASIIVGFLIGYERYSRSKEAGVRTHAIVCIGACIIMLVSTYGFGPEFKQDPGRIASQVVSGIGFLGAGIIFVNKGTTHGLTTAAGIWATSAIGLCFGAGMYEIGFITGILNFVLQKYLHLLYPYVQPANSMKLRIHVKDGGDINQINTLLASLNLNHGENKIIGVSDDEFIVETEIVSRNNISPKLIKDKLESIEDIRKVGFN